MMNFSTSYGMPFFVPFLVIGIIFFTLATIIIWIWSIVDCIKSDLETEEKLLWMIILLLFNIVGSVLYFFLAKKLNQNKKTTKKIKSANMKKIFRNTDNQIIAGVCSGLGDYLNVDFSIIRLIWVLITFLTGFFPGIIAYIIAAIIIPEK